MSWYVEGLPYFGSVLIAKAHSSYNSTEKAFDLHVAVMKKTCAGEIFSRAESINIDGASIMEASVECFVDGKAAERAFYQSTVADGIYMEIESIFYGASLDHSGVDLAIPSLPQTLASFSINSTK